MASSNVVLTISGQITKGGTGLSGVTITLTGGPGGTQITNASGNYSFASLPAGGNYTVTPALVNQTFSSPSITLNNLQANHTAVNFTAVVNGSPRIQSDLNGDRSPDLIWQNDSTRQVTVNYYGGSGGASYQGWNWLNTGTNVGWRVVAAADFNGDGVPDLIWQNDTTRQVTVNYYGGSGGASYQGWNWLNTGNNVGWRVVAAADFNGDAIPDLVWQNDTTRQVTVNYYGGSGGASYQGWNWLNVANSTGWRVVAAADFNGDAIPDLVWQNDTTRQVTVNYYGGSGGASYQGWNWLNTANTAGWRVVAAADFNGDAIPDLVWQNDSTRQVTVNYYGGSGGASYQGWSWLNTANSAGWSLMNLAAQ